MISINENDSKDDRVLVTIIDKSILVVQINREKRRNAVDKKTADDLYKAFKEFEADENLLIAILCGSGRNFCSGGDLIEFSKGIENANKVLPPSISDYGPMGPTRLQLSKPVISAIDGYCVAGGLELALWCDFRIATIDSIFGVYCRRWGVPLIDGGTIRLPRLIGESRAMDLILTGRSVDANEAYQIGLINRLIQDRSKLMEESIKIAKQIISFPQKCLRSDRMSTLQQWNFNNLKDALENEYNLSYESFINEGYKGSIKFTNGEGRHGNSLNYAPPSKL